MDLNSPEEYFQQAVTALAEDRIDDLALIGAAETLNGEGRVDLAVRLYQMGIAAGMRGHLLYAANYNLGMSLRRMGDEAAAQAAFEQVLSIEPGFHPARLNLGLSLVASGDRPAALDHWKTTIDQLVDVSPTNLRYKKMALCYLAYHLEDSHRYAEAEVALAASLGLDRTQKDVLQHWVAARQQQCRWPVLQPLDGLGRSDMLRSVMPLSLLAFSDDPLLQLGSAWNYNLEFTPPREPAVHVAPRPPKRRLRVGYLSSDLRSHAVGYLMPQVFERHDREAFEIIAYYTGRRDQDPLSARLCSHVDRWVELGDMDDRAAADAIAGDELDILVDLNGNTRDARTAVVAARPAPVVVNWLGYPGTMASPYHHYIIADDWIVPPSHELYYSEKVLRLPCYQPNDTSRVAAPSPSRAELGLPDDATVFCCFNSEHKITQFVFDRWMSILGQVPDSVLWLFETSNDSRRNLEAVAEGRGIAAHRLVFAPKLPNAKHLARYPVADLFLDTAPYGAHTTGSDALWMGLPVLTLSGRSFVSRVCGSLVRSAGLPELVCSTPAEYVEKAVALGRDRAELERLKQRLVSGRDDCILFDMERHVRALEDLYRSMWADFQSGRLPVPDLANLAAYLDVGVRLDNDAADSMEPVDLHGRYRQELARMDRMRPLAVDGRLWPGR